MIDYQVITINLTPNLSSPPIVNVSQGDVGRLLAFVFVDGTKQILPGDVLGAGVTIKIQGTKPSGLGFSQTCSSTAGTYAYFTTTLEMTQEAGQIPAEVQFSNVSSVIASANFILNVERDPHPDGTTDGTTEVLQSLQEQIGDLSDLTTTANSNLVAAINEAAQSGGGGGGGGGVTVDSALSSSSTNPVQNKVIYGALPASASISSGVISFKNGAGTTLFSVTLPVYSGGVS